MAALAVIEKVSVNMISIIVLVEDSVEERKTFVKEVLLLAHSLLIH
jgi:heme exporter protein D